MHAFLLTGNPADNFESGLSNLASKFNAKLIDFPITKIEDTRNLNNFLSLSMSEPTLIVCKNIHSATIEALNSFLKNLEEPQDNVYFALTAPNANKVLETIVSRCSVIKLNNSLKIENKTESENFLNLKTGQKLAFFDKMKDREVAIKFIENIIFFLHSTKKINNMELLIKTLTGLKANGNVNLHLTNLAINLDS